MKHWIKYFSKRRSVTQKLLIAFGILCLISVEQTSAQTPVTEIKNASGDSVLVSFEEGSLLGLGFLGLGSIPVEGAGVRMMWYPAKAAFRAGRVGVASGNSIGDEWNEANIGDASVALGRDVMASGTGSVALGYDASASDYGSVALGLGANASGNTAVALGDGTEASGTASTAMGRDAIASGGFGTVAMGLDVVASGASSLATGRETIASGPQSTAMGYETTAATSRSLTIGRANNANSTGDNTLFVAGNGIGTNTSDALVLDKNGSLEISGTLTESSDRRLKTNISPINDNTLRKLSNITPSTFEFKNQQTHPAGIQIGLIAQEVQNEFPELVNSSSKGHLSVSYSKFTAVLLKGMQEQQKELEQQRAQNKTQSRQIATLQKRLDKVEREEQRTANLPVTSKIMLGAFLAGGLLWKTAKNND